ncbi:hypothetical protein F5880DRAFT_1443288, partial [Lentinula raphanica]
TLLIPAWSMIMVLLTYFTYMALTIYGTPAFDDISAVTGSRSVYDQEAFFLSYASYTQNEGNTNLELYDAPIELVNCVLY